MLDASTGGHNLLLKDFVATIGFGEFELQFPLTENGNHSSDVESLFEQKESHVFIECGAQTALVYPVATTGLCRASWQKILGSGNAEPLSQTEAVFRASESFHSICAGHGDSFLDVYATCPVVLFDLQ